MKKIYLVVLGLILVSLSGCSSVSDNQAQINETRIKSYQECLDKGGEDQGTYPEKCLKDDKNYINKSQKLINQPMGTKKVKFETSLGDFELELDGDKAPTTVSNFINYVENDFYNGLVFHRIIQDFMIQGGGFEQDGSEKATKSPIVNEAENGLKNDKYTIAMARTFERDSATSQFFINTKNNNDLNYGVQGDGYAVFGKVVKGMETIDKIAAVKVVMGAMGEESEPVEAVIIEKAYLVE